MTAPLEGIKVLEVATWLAAPCCAALLSDLGADVIKVEAPGGDGYRKLFASVLGDEHVAPNYQFDNRGKRGICVDLDQTEGIELVHDLVRNADIFITNLTKPRLQRYRLTDTDVHALSPSAIYAALAGYAVDGLDSDRQAFDQTAFWARSGAMSMFGDRDEGPVLLRGGYGDRTTAVNMLSAILAALRIRDKTGEPQYVEVTLQRTGVWALASDINNALFDRVQPPKSSRKAPANPIWNFYQTRDGRWLAMIMPQVLNFWAKFCAAVGRDDWARDQRFTSYLGFIEHGPELVPEIEALFASEDLEHWHSVLDEAGLIWAPAAELPEVIDDPVLRESGAFSMIVHPRAGAMEIVNTPFSIRGSDVEVRGPAPDVGEHTREVFEELGLAPERIDELVTRGILR